METQIFSGGGEPALLHKMTASLAIVCFILGIVSAGGSAAHNSHIMTQVSEKLLMKFSSYIPGWGGRWWLVLVGGRCLATISVYIYIQLLLYLFFENTGGYL